MNLLRKKKQNTVLRQTRMVTCTTSAALHSLAALSLKIDPDASRQARQFGVIVDRVHSHHSPSVTQHVVRWQNSKITLSKTQAFDKERWKHWTAATRPESTRSQVSYFPDPGYGESPLFVECVLPYLRDGHFDSYLKSLRFPCKESGVTGEARTEFLERLQRLLGPTSVECWTNLERLVQFLNVLFTPGSGCETAWIQECRTNVTYDTVSFCLQGKVVRFCNALKALGLTWKLSRSAGLYCSTVDVHVSTKPLSCPALVQS